MIEAIDQLPLFVRMIVSLIIVIALMGGLAMIVKKLGLSNMQVITKGQEQRLSVIERLPIDPRRQLVLLKRDEAEHLVILGPEGETVVEANIQTKPAKRTTTKKKAAA